MTLVRSEDYGAALRDAGMALAARRRSWKIKMGQLALLQAIRSNPERVATTDDVTSNVGEKYSDGGRWRGSIPRQLVSDGLIESAGVVKSVRSHRHRGYVTLWRGVNDAAIDERISELEQWLAVHPAPSEKAEATGQTLFDNQNKTPDIAMPGAHN